MEKKMMNTLTTRDMEQHVRTLGWILIAVHAIFLVIGAFVFALLVGIGAISGSGDATAILGLVAIFVAALMALLALPGILAGYGLLNRKPWGRILAIVVAAINLVNFPLGTILGAYALWVLLQRASEEYFIPTSPAYR
jgi:hypothetical protein